MEPSSGQPDTAGPPPEATELASAFVAAYRDYVRGRVEALVAGPADGPSDGPTNEEVPGLAAALEEGSEWLDVSLRNLFAVPPASQRRSPLELFREAMRFPTEALAVAGVEPVARDHGERDFLPGDLYGLAPGTSRELGERAWRAHLAWGVTKARAVAGVVPAASPARPSRAASPAVVALFGSDLMDRSKIEGAAEAAGYRLQVWRNPGALVDGLETPPALAFVDLKHVAADDAVRALAAAGVRMIAFGPHVDDLALARAKALGADEVLPRSRFFVRLADLFPVIV